RNTLFIVARFGLRLAVRALQRGVFGQSLEGVVSPGCRLIGPDLVNSIYLFALTVHGLLSVGCFWQILAQQLELVWYGVRHDSELLQRLLDLFAVIRCHVGHLCNRWND